MRNTACGCSVFNFVYNYCFDFSLVLASWLLYKYTEIWLVVRSRGLIAVRYVAIAATFAVFCTTRVLRASPLGADLSNVGTTISCSSDSSWSRTRQDSKAIKSKVSTIGLGISENLPVPKHSRFNWPCHGRKRRSTRRREALLFAFTDDDVATTNRHETAIYYIELQINPELIGPAPIYFSRSTTEYDNEEESEW